LVDGEVEIQKLKNFFRSTLLSAALAALPFTAALAGGGMVLEGDVCIIRIDFYSLHFTAYQPTTSGSKQFCQKIPETGATIFVLDYLHPSLKEVPVSFRIIHDVTGQGSFVKLKHVEKIADLERHTVFYQPPIIQTDASLTLDIDFAEEGKYIGIITAGHPSNNVIYTAVFPFEVGGTNAYFWILLVLLLAISAFFLVRRVSQDRRKVSR